MRRFAFTILAAVSLAFSFAQAQGPVTIQLILDASGSMFNQLEDGRYRITAAKDVLASVISALPQRDGLNVGLRVYGSQLDALADGACEDSELFVPMEGFDRGALLEAVRNVQARGATPIAYSLLQAGQDLQGFEGEKIIVLVTDGEEACAGDVRAAAEALTAQGIDVDLRIIGFDLTEAAAASFEGIGTFVNARNAQELGEALVEAVEPATDEIQAFDVTVEVTRGGEPAEGASVTLVSAVDGSTHPLELASTGTLTGSVPAGQYQALVEDAQSTEPLRVSGLSITPDGENRFTIELAPAAEVQVTVEPLEPVAGSDVTVTWSGAPEQEGNWVTIVPADVPDDVYRAWAYVDGASGSVDLVIPPEPMELEARFLIQPPEGGNRVVGRSERFTSTEPEVSVQAPAEVLAGSTFDVAWTGPNNDRDYITIVEEGARQGTYTDYTYTRVGSPVQITASPEPGTYEVRYVAGQGDSPTLASQTIEVVAAEASVSAPSEVVAGSTFDVSWTGPNNDRDYITIVEQGARQGTYLNYAYTRVGSTVQITAPPQPGTYEVRYVAGQGNSPTLASQTIEVVAAEASVTAPTEVIAGSTFDVSWTGPNNDRDYITIVEQGARQGTYLNYAYTSAGSTVQITAPPHPGTYEVRYVAGQGDSPTLASQTIEVIPAEASVSAPAEIAAGSVFDVTWTGPDNHRDYVTIVPAGAPQGAYTRYAYTSAGSPAQIQAPDEPGTYEVRYVAGQGNSPTLASQTVTVVAE